MRPPVDATIRANSKSSSRLRKTVPLNLVGALVLLAGCQALPRADAGEPPRVAPAPTTTVPRPETTLPSPTTTVAPAPIVGPPPPSPQFVVPATEVAPEAKQYAADLAYLLTTYEETSDHAARFEGLFAPSDFDVGEPLTHAGHWSRGEVVYPQLGGLTANRASVMVVTRQTVGRGSNAEWSVLRTIDIRLVRTEMGWEFDRLSSAGGTFETIDDLGLAHKVAHDPRIEMPDSARLDILSGLVSPTLLEVMAELAEHTDYAVTVLATGHPHNVFETDRQSHHTVGRAVDIYRIGSELVIDGRHDPDSASLEATRWMYDHPDVVQVGSPWDLDRASSSRSFTNEVHQDHIHLAVRK